MNEIVLKKYMFYVSDYSKKKKEMEHSYLYNALMVMFPLFDVTDVFLDGFFYDNVKENSDSLLSVDEKNTLKGTILTFLVLGCMATVINIGIFILHFLQQRKLKPEERESKLPLQWSPFMTLLKDLPQVIICLIVAFELETYICAHVQLGKAIFTIGKSVFYLVYFLLTLRKKWKDKKPVLSIIDCGGNTLLLLCSIVLLYRLGTF